jgi:KUP system potassium uptake protein
MKVLSPAVTASASEARPSQRLAALTALGVVYGDLGTSPLYTLQTVVEATGGHFTAESALGVLSLIVWTLILTISIKYCLFVMRADNHGEGGILALMSLVGANSFQSWGKVPAVMGLLGAPPLYGDGVIRPAISVLGALEECCHEFVEAIRHAGFCRGSRGLFALQRFGTAKIGGAFGPIMLVWFIVIGILGVSRIVHNPAVLAAVDPRHAISFLTDTESVSFLALGGVFLCITGDEALYADMGHFGAGPIRLSWYTIVLPALLLSYAGQTAFWSRKGGHSGKPLLSSRRNLGSLSPRVSGDGRHHHSPASLLLSVRSQ